MGFWHIDAGTLTVLALSLGTFYKVSVMHYQHNLMWRDYVRRHKLDEGHEIYREVHT